MRSISEVCREATRIRVGGDALAVTTVTPGSALPRGLVVLHPATATPQAFYAAFADHLAGQGLAVVTYDYRGIGDSGAARQHRHVRMRDWMEEDVPAVADWARQQFPGVPTFAVGHSVGGHALALGCGLEGVHALVLVSSHAGVTARIEAAGERARVRAFFALAPALGRVLGYAPSRRAGFGEDLPTGVVEDWAPWTRHRDYFFADPTMRARERMAAVQLPVLAVGVSDDPWATPRQISAITDHLSSAEVERRTLTPVDLGATRVGHHGLFRRGVGQPFWDDLLTWWGPHGLDLP